MITMLTTRNCQGCKLAKKIMDKNGTRYIEVSKEERPDLLEKAKDRGAASFPVFFDSRGGYMFSGFSVDKIKKL